MERICSYKIFCSLLSDINRYRILKLLTKNHKVYLRYYKIYSKEVNILYK